jgi:hypothetical protein
VSTWWGSLEGSAKTILTLGALGVFVVGGVRACDSLVSAEGLDKHVEQQAGVDSGQNTVIRQLDAEQDLLWQTQVKLTTDVDWLKQEVYGVRQDLRRMDRGQPLGPVPSSTPTPAVATPTPRRRVEVPTP